MRQPAQHPNRTRLAGAVGAEKSEDRSGCNGEGNLPDGLNAAETLAQLVEHDHRFIHLRNVIAMAERNLQPGDVPLISCLRNSLPFAGGDLAILQGASAVPISAAISAKGATPENRLR